MSSMTELGSRPIVCYDQDCGLCRGSVRLLVALRLVPQGHLAPFQSFEEELAGRLLEANVHNELAVLETIREAATAALNAYPPPNDDIPAAFLSRNQRMARRLVQTEQRILQKTVAATERKARELQSAPPNFERRTPDLLSNFK